MARIDWKALLVQYSGLLLILEGAFYENLFGPSLIGWGFIFVGLFWEWIWPNQHFTNLPPQKFVWLLLLVAGVSLWVTANPEGSRVPVSQLATSALAYMALVGWLRHVAHKQIVTMGLVGLGGALAVAAPFIIEWQKYKSGILPDALYAALPVLLSDPVHPNIMATLMVLLFPLPLVMSIRLWQNGRFLTMSLFGLTAVFMMAILFLTRSRGGYLAGGIAFILTLILTGYRRLGITLLAVLGIALIALLLIEPAGQADAVSGVSDTDTFAFRLQVWRQGVEIVRDFPLTGVGMGEFNAVSERLYPFPQLADQGAHNLYLQVAVELGLIGLIAWVGFLGNILFNGWRRVWRGVGETAVSPTAVFLGLLIGLTGYVLHGLIDLTVWGTRMTIMPWLVLATLTAYLYNQEEDRARPRG